MRVLTVLEVLQARERVTGRELARLLETHHRTVQRYVARLQDLGIPVESIRGARGGYRLRPGFRLPPLMFTNEEALALSLGLSALRHLGLTAFAPAREGAGAKLERVLPENVRQEVGTLQAALKLEIEPWVVSTDVQNVTAFAAAVRTGNAVEIKYASYQNRVSQRVIEPYGIIHHAGRWFVVGHCRLRQDLRVFRLDRVSAPVLLDDMFEKPNDFDAHAFLLDALSFSRSQWHIEVWLDIPPELVRQGLPPARAVLEASGEGTRLRCGAEDLEGFAGLLLSLNCTVVVHNPPELRGAFRAVAERAHKISTPT